MAGHDRHEQDGESHPFAESLLCAVARRTEGVQDGDQPPHAEDQHGHEYDASNGGVEQVNDQDRKAVLGLDENDSGQGKYGHCEQHSGAPSSGVELAEAGPKEGQARRQQGRSGSPFGRGYLRVDEFGHVNDLSTASRLGPS